MYDYEIHDRLFSIEAKIDHSSVRKMCVLYQQLIYITWNKFTTHIIIIIITRKFTKMLNDSHYTTKLATEENKERKISSALSKWSNHLGKIHLGKILN